MKSITETEYDDLCKVCDSILKNESNSFERNANSFLSVVREHPIFLNIYKPVFFKSNLKFYLYIFISFFKTIIKGAFKFLDAIYRVYFLKDVLKKDLKKYKVIFITHFLNEKFINHKDDFYFYELPKKFDGSLTYFKSEVLIPYKDFDLTFSSNVNPNNQLFQIGLVKGF